MTTKKTATKEPATKNTTPVPQIGIKTTLEVRDQFNALAKSKAMPAHELIVYLLSLADMPVNLADDPLFPKIVETAKNKGVSVEKFVITACEKAIKQAEIVRENPADKRIDDYVQSVIDANVKAKNWYEKVEITQVKIADVTGCNRPAITKYLAVNANRLTEHYTACGIEIDKEHTHNRKVARYLSKQAKGG